MKRRSKTAIALTVAGSDSGGGAGIQADLGVFRALGVFGTAAITCVTAQNPRRVSSIQPIKPTVVTEQMERVFEAFPVTAAKTGMLYNAAIIATVAAAFRRHRLKHLVIDPVMVATSGSVLLKKNAVAALVSELFPFAQLLTPNRGEVEVLTERRVRNLAEMREAARAMANEYGVAVLAKGGHLPGADKAVDVLYDGHEFHEFRATPVRNVRLHGTGCALSAAITGYLAQGDDLVTAVRRGKQFVTRAIRNAITVGKFHALNY